MKNAFPSLFYLAIYFLVVFNYKPKMPIDYAQKELDYLQMQTDSVQYVIILKKLLRDNVTYKNFKKYNPEIKRETVRKFIDVIEHFKLDTAGKFTNHFIAQFVMESGAQQRYKSTHRKRGRIVTSSGHAIGISQIVPTTAFTFLKLATKEHREKLKEIGCSDFAFVDDYKLYYVNDKGKRHIHRKARKEIKQWLYDENNNIILWGYIMSQHFKKFKYIHYCFISYYGGQQYLKNYLKEGKYPSRHVYVVGINSIARTLDKPESLKTANRLYLRSALLETAHLKHN